MQKIWQLLICQFLTKTVGLGLETVMSAVHMVLGYSKLCIYFITIFISNYIYIIVKTKFGYYSCVTILLMLIQII